MSSYDPFKHYNSASSGTKRPQPPYQFTSQPRMPTSLTWPTEEKTNLETPSVYRWVPPQPPLGTPLTWPTEQNSGPETAPSYCWMPPQYSPVQSPIVPAPELPNPESSTHQLVYHYATNLSTSYLSSTSPVETLPVYQEAVNRHYLGHSCVYQALLTFSALHLASLTPQPYSGILLSSDASSSPTSSYPSSYSSPYLIAALSHKAWALGQFRGMIESVTTETCEPALAASALLTACTFGLPLAGAVCDTVDLLWQIMSLYQGTTTLFRMGGWFEDEEDDWMSRRARSQSAATTASSSGYEDSGSGSDLDFDGGGTTFGYAFPSCASPTLLQQPPPPPPHHRHDGRRRVRRGSETSWPEAEAAVDAVLAAIAALPEDDENDGGVVPINDTMSVRSSSSCTKQGRGAVLAEAAAQLRTSLRRMAAARGLFGPAVEWLGMVPAGFVARVQLRDPLALVLLATWAAGGLAYIPGEVWWVRGWPDRTLAAAARAVDVGSNGDDRQYAHLLRWAATEVHRQGG
jgi:hypothetical protein